MPVSINGTNGLIDANLLGNVTGNLAGDVTGNVTGDITAQNIQTTSLTATSNLITPPGTILQTVSNQVVPATTITLPVLATTYEITDVTPLTITKRSQNSKFLIELTGGRYSTIAANQGISTWIYISLNGGAYAPITGSTSTQYANEFIFAAPGGIQGPHCIRYVYTPVTSFNTLAIKVYAKSYGAGGQVWAYNNTDGAIPITYSITEIAT